MQCGRFINEISSLNNLENNTFNISTRRKLLPSPYHYESDKNILTLKLSKDSYTIIKDKIIPRYYYRIIQN